MQNVLFIMGSLGGGGAERVLIDLLNNIDRNELSITLLLIDAFKGIYIHQIPSDIEVIKVYNKNPGIKRRVLYKFPDLSRRLLKRDVDKKLGNRKFDAIISWCEGRTFSAHSTILERAHKNITWVHTNLDANHWTAWCWSKRHTEEDAYSLMDDIVFVSEGARSAFQRKFGISNNLHTIYNVIDRESIIKKAEEQKIEKEKFTIINVGRLEAQKRQDHIIEVAKILKERNYDFEVWILGVGSKEKELKDYTKALGVDDRVKFLGFNPNPYPYIKAADMFLLTSDTEGYPTVICEALCLGTPIVSTNITGSDELLANGIGILTTLDVTSIANSVEKLIVNQELRRKLSNRAIEKSKEFNPENVLSQIYSLVKS